MTPLALEEKALEALLGRRHLDPRRESTFSFSLYVISSGRAMRVAFKKEPKFLTWKAVKVAIYTTVKNIPVGKVSTQCVAAARPSQEVGFTFPLLFKNRP